MHLATSISVLECPMLTKMAPFFIRSMSGKGVDVMITIFGNFSAKKMAL
jgi:hypothetical protein